VTRLTTIGFSCVLRMTETIRSGKIVGDAAQHAVQFRVFEQKAAGPLLVVRVEHGLDRMRERPVTDIMQQRSAQRGQPLFLRPVRIAEPLELGDDPARNLIDAERMGEPAVLGAVERQIGRAELADPAEPLKLLRVDEVPDNPVFDIDGFVNRIFEHFLFGQFVVHARHPFRNSTVPSQNCRICRSVSNYLLMSEERPISSPEPDFHWFCRVFLRNGGVNFLLFSVDYYGNGWYYK